MAYQPRPIPFLLPFFLRYLSVIKDKTEAPCEPE